MKIKQEVKNLVSVSLWGPFLQVFNKQITTQRLSVYTQRLSVYTQRLLSVHPAPAGDTSQRFISSEPVLHPRVDPALRIISSFFLGKKNNFFSLIGYSPV
jgi:hypothetical protein